MCSCAKLINLVGMFILINAHVSVQHSYSLASI